MHVTIWDVRHVVTFVLVRMPGVTDLEKRPVPNKIKQQQQPQVIVYLRSNGRDNVRTVRTDRS